MSVKRDFIELKANVVFAIKIATIMVPYNSAFVALDLSIKMGNVFQIVLKGNTMTKINVNVSLTVLSLLKSGTKVSANVLRASFVIQYLVSVIHHVDLLKFAKEALASAYKDTIKEYFSLLVSPSLVLQVINGIQRKGSADQYALGIAKF